MRNKQRSISVQPSSMPVLKRLENSLSSPQLASSNNCILLIVEKHNLLRLNFSAAAL
uniref:Uncharacterized protein n=1 Tax=Rhizophora mucronata TaxID=61149 RepID=A0A2P2JAE5_RHIMU